MKPCRIDGCDRDAKARQLCKMHYDRLRATGDPLRKSRFDTPEEKAAFIAQERAERRARQARQREERQAQAEQLRLLQVRGLEAIRPDAVAMSEAIDRLPAAEKAAVVSIVVSVLMGRDIDIDNIPTAHS